MIRGRQDCEVVRASSQPTDDCKLQAADWNLPPALLLFFLIAFLFFAKLGDRGLMETSEARYAETAREMYLSGDWVTPRFFGVKHFHKPPLTYWLTEAGYSIFGVNELGARFFLAVSAIASCLLTWWLGRRWFGERAALLAAAILATSTLVAVFGRILTADTFLMTATTAAICAYAAGWYLAMWAAAAAGFLVKGPIALAIVAAAVVPHLLRHAPAGQWRRMRPLAGPAIFCAIAMPWFVAVCLKNPGLFNQFVFYETIDRLTTTVHHRAGPAHYFLGIFLAGFFPWSLLTPVAAWRNRTETGSRRAALETLCWWFLLPFVLFSSSRSKLPAYILPLMPAAALFVAAWLDRALESAALDRPARVSLGLGAAFGALAALYGALRGPAAVVETLQLHLLMAAPVLGLWVLAAIRGRTRAALAATFAAALYVPAMLLPFGDRVESDVKSLKPIAIALRELAGPRTPIVLCRLSATSIPFYVGRVVYTYECQHDLRYEENPQELRRFHLDDIDQLIELLGKGEAFMMIDAKTRRRVEFLYWKKTRRRLHEVARSWKYRLLTNGAPRHHVASGLERVGAEDLVEDSL